LVNENNPNGLQLPQPIAVPLQSQAQNKGGLAFRVQASLSTFAVGGDDLHYRPNSEENPVSGKYLTVSLPLIFL
jgi:hypothetical protein